MALACGCEIIGGGPVSQEVVKKHYKHTLEAILFWELLRRPGTPQGDDHMKLSQARCDLFDALDKLYPEASQD